MNSQFRQVFIRHADSVDQHQAVQYLNIDQPVLALCRGGNNEPIVAIGTASHLLIYHVTDNKIMFSKEVNPQIVSFGERPGNYHFFPDDYVD